MTVPIVFFAVGLCFYHCYAEQLSEPSRPTNLRVTNISSGSLRLSWDPPANNGGAPVFEYKLWTQRGGSRRAWDEGERLLVSDYTTNIDGSKSYVENFNSTTRLITGLARDTLYRFMVSARNSKSTYGPPSLESAEVRTLAEERGRMYVSVWHQATNTSTARFCEMIPRIMWKLQSL